MKNLRTPIPHLHELSEKDLDIILSDSYMYYPVTEKTDGFCFQVGYDVEGFFVRSGTSPKMRKFGDFSKEAFNKYKNSQTICSSKIPSPFKYDPIISLRLDYALNLLSNMYNLNKFLKRASRSISGEMVLLFDKVPFTPNQTNYDRIHLNDIGRFIIHTRSPLNYHLNYSDIVELKDGCSSILAIDDDSISLAYPSIFIEDLLEKRKEKDFFKRLYKRILSDIPRKSKWGFGKPEGFVFHVNNELKFKVMLNSEYSNEVL